MYVYDLLGEDPLYEARRVWARRGNKVVIKFRCTTGHRKGRLVSTPQQCSAPINLKRRYIFKKTKARLGPRIKRRTARTKKFNPITKRVTAMNKSMRPKVKSVYKGSI